jgi:hypothetical protein
MDAVAVSDRRGGHPCHLGYPCQLDPGLVCAGVVYVYVIPSWMCLVFPCPVSVSVLTRYSAVFCVKCVTFSKIVSWRVPVFEEVY